ncbi:MAG: helix-turn-helix transcriptional regulator [Actinomycetota bacterium]|nr:WYL domain-containing protein [Actinomycetota bacterium]
MAEIFEGRMKRLLLLIPYVIQNPEVSVSELCKKFELTRGQLVKDLDMLFYCGLPGYGPGDLIESFVDGDHVVIRMADYFSKPLRLTASEGLLLYSGAQAMIAAGNADGALIRAMERLADALGEDVLSRVSIDLEGTSDLAKVQEALETDRRVHIVYQSRSKDEVTERDVDPWALFASAGGWYLVGWCHLVGSERLFRLDRVKQMSVTDTPSTQPPDFDISKYQTLYIPSKDDLEVVIDLAPQAAEWVARYYPLTSEDRLDDDWVRVTLRAGGTAWLERLLLRLGEQARVVEPKELAERVESLACRLLDRYV